MKNRFRDMDLEPRTAEEMKECDDPRGMRKRLFKYSFHSSLVRHVYRSAEHQGLSGEDTMTWLAFEAMRRLEKYEDAAFDQAMLNPIQPLILVRPQDNVEAK